MAANTHLVSIAAPNDSLVEEIRDDLRRTILPAFAPFLGCTWDTAPTDPNTIHHGATEATSGMSLAELRSAVIKFDALFASVDGSLRLETSTPMLVSSWLLRSEPPPVLATARDGLGRNVRNPYLEAADAAWRRHRAAAAPRGRMAKSLRALRSRPTASGVATFMTHLFDLIDNIAVGYSYPTLAVTLPEGVVGSSAMGRRLLRATLREFEETHAAEFGAGNPTLLREAMFMGPRGGLSVIEDIIVGSPEAGVPPWAQVYEDNPVYRDRRDQTWWPVTTRLSADDIDRTCSRADVEPPGLPDVYPPMVFWPPPSVTHHKRLGPWLTARTSRGRYHPRAIYNYTIVQ